MEKRKYFNLFSILIILGITVVIISCDPELMYPSLKVVNQHSRTIYSVRLVGYEFNNLLITTDSSQNFILENGMPGGYKDINIIVIYGSGSATWSISKKVNFENGKTTTITLKTTSSGVTQLE